MANSDRFLLEISAKLKDNTIAKEIKQTISDIEKNSKVTLNFDQKKADEYIEKLKKSISEINSSMNDASIQANANSFSKFVDVLKEGANYSSTISNNLQQAAEYMKVITGDVTRSSAKKGNNTNTTTTNNSGKQGTNAGNNNIAPELKEYLKLTNSISGEIDNIKEKMSNIKMSDKLLKDFNKMEKMLKSGFDVNNSDAIKKQTDNINKLYQNIKEVSDKAISNYKTKMDVKESYVSSKYNKYDLGDNYNKKLYSSNDTYKQQIDSYIEKTKEYKKELDLIRASTNTAFDKTKISEMSSELNKLKKNLTDSSYKEALTVLPTSTSKEDARNELLKFAKSEKGTSLKNSSFSEHANGIIKLTANLKTADGQIQKNIYTYNSATGAINKMAQSTKQAASSADEMGNGFGSAFKTMLKMSLIYNISSKVFQKMREGVQVVKDMDIALTEMQKVSSESLSNLQAYSAKTFDIANRIGTTGLALQQSTADWMRLGKSINEASSLAQDTSLLMNVSEFSNVEDATKSMVSMTQAYQELSSDEIVDKLNLTGNNYSIATDELARSLQKSSSALKTAKNDFDEAIALTVAGNSVVQDPDSVAAGVRTIALRMAGTEVAKKELENIGEEVDDVLTKSKLNDKLEKLTSIDERGGIKLLDDSGNNRSTAKTLIELADRWEEIGKKDNADGENRQSAILEMLAGKNRANILASILNDKDLLKNVYEDVSTNYEGSAMKENEKYINSIEGHMNKLNNTWQEFWASDINRDFINTILDLSNGFVELLNSIGGAKVALTAFLLMFAEIRYDKIVTKALSGIASGFSEIFSTGALNSVSKKITEGYSNAVSTGISKIPKMSTVKTSLLNLGKFLFTTPLGLASTGIAVGVGLYAGYKAYINDMEKATERSKNAIDDYKNVTKELSITKEKIPDLAKEYDSLKDGVSKSGENLSLTNDEFKRYNEIVDEITSKFPSLISGYTSTGDAILNMKDSMTSLNDAYDDTLKKKARESIKESPLKDQKKAIKNTRRKNYNDHEEDLYKSIGTDIMTKDSWWHVFDITDSKIKKSSSKMQGIVDTTIDDIGNSLSENIKKTLDLQDFDIYRSLTDRDENGNVIELDQLSKSLAFDKKSYNSLVSYYKKKLESGDANSDEIEAFLEYLESSVSEYSEQYELMKSRLVTFAQSKDRYYDMSNEQRSSFDSLIMNLSEEDYNTYSDEENMKKLLNKFVSYSSNNASMISSLYDLDNIYGKDITIKEAEKQVSKIKGKISAGTGLSSKTIEDAFKLNDRDYTQYTSDIVSRLKNLDDENSKSHSDIIDEQIEKLENEKNKNLEKIPIKDYVNLKNNKLKYGNIDLNNRTPLAWTKENIKKYKNALKSWGEKNPEDLLGSVSTVSGSWGTYKKDKSSFDIAFSPMLQTENGVEYLDQTTVDNYINSILDEASKDGKITNDELLKLDTKGLEVDGKKIKGLIADVGETAKQTAENMHYLGKNGAIDLLNQEIKALDGSKFDLANISEDTLKSNFSENELKTIYENLPNFQEELLTNYQNGLYKYYKNFEEYVIKSMQFLSKQSQDYLGENKSFSQLSDNASSYSNTLAELNNLGNDNVKITDDMANTLKTYDKEIANYIDSNGKENGSIITNIKAVKELIKEKQRENSINAKNSKETARFEYSKTVDELTRLTDELYKTADAEGVLNEQILENINSTQSQLYTIDRNIQRYAQLEQQLIGTSNAFDVYNKAVEYDASNNSFSNMKTMMDSIKSAFNTGKYGEETFDAAIKGILSDEEYDKIMQIEDSAKRIEAIRNKYNQANQYLKTNDDGDIKYSSLEKFVTTAQSKGLFTGKGMTDFHVADGITLEKFADNMGYSKEMIYSMLEQIQKHNADPKSNIFEDFQKSDFDKNSNDIKNKDEELIDLNKKKQNAIIERAGIKDKESKEYKELTNVIDDYTVKILDAQAAQSGLYDQNVKNVQSYINNKNEIERVTQELSLYEDKLKELKKDPEKNEKAIAEVELNVENARTELGTLLREREKLGEPVAIDLELAKTDITKQISEKKKEINKILKENKINEKYTSSEQILKLIPKLGKADQKTVKNLNSEIDALNKDVKEIDIALGVETEEYDGVVKQIKADKKELNKDVSFKLEAKNATQTANNLEGVKLQMQAIRDIGDISSTISVNVNKSETSSGNDEPSPSRSKPKKGKHKVLGDVFALGSNNLNYSSGKTLVGEFGAEMVVDPYSGTYSIVGRNGAEFVNIPRDAIVFNHRQTEQLEKTNNINSRGKLISNASSRMKNFSHALGNTGRACADILRYNAKNNNNKKSSKSGNNSNKDTKSLVDNLFDWIEIRLERLSNKTQKWITLAENAISKSVQKSHYSSAMSAKTSEISQNQTAKDKYLAQANALIKKSGVKNASAYAKKVRDGSLSIQSISNEKLKDFLSSYKEMYDKAVECSNAVMSLTGELQELAQTLYNLPIEHANKKISKYSDKMDVLSAKYENYRSYTTQNPNLDEQTKLQKSIKSAYDSAYKETKSNLSSAKGKINSTSDKALKGLTSAQKKKIVSYVKDGKEINIANSYSATLKKAIANYNAALESNRVAANESAKASAEYTKVLRENTNAKYENIAAYYDTRRSWADAHISSTEAKMEYRKSLGHSATSTAHVSTLEERLKYLKDQSKQISDERALFNKSKLDKEYKDGKLSRVDYYAQLSHMEELESSAYETAAAINDLQEEIKNVKVTSLQHIIDELSRKFGKLDNLIGLNDARNIDNTEKTYTDQIALNLEEIEQLNEQNKIKKEQIKYYAVNSEKYQTLASEIADIDKKITDKFIDNEELKNSIMALRFKELDKSSEEIETQISDMQHLKNLLSDDELINDSGSFTESGLATILLTGNQIEKSQQKITDYRYALEKLTENYKVGNLSLEEYTEQSREYITTIQNTVSAIDEYRDSLISLYEEQLKVENEALDDSIEKRKQALQAKKDYYDYDKSLKSANKDIVNLKNQIAALEGVNNASAKAEVERLKAQLSEAEENLADSKYQHEVELQLSGYDEMVKAADENMNELLEDLKTNAELQEKVVSEMLNNIVNNYDSAYSQVKKIIESTAINSGTSDSLSNGKTALADPTNTNKTSYGEINSSKITDSNSYTSEIEKNATTGGTYTDNRTIVELTPKKTSVSLVAGKSETVSCSYRPTDAIDKNLTATTSNTKVATVSTSGTSVTIKAVAKGSCSVTVKATNGTGVATISVSVSAPPVVKQPDPPKQPAKQQEPPKQKKTNTKSTAGYISSISATLSKTSSASNIKKVQTALKALGFKGKDGKALTIDGKWGTNTDYAVKNFQKSSKYGGKITADGIIGKNTKAKFKKAGYFKGGIVDNVINNAEFLNMIRMNNDDGLITAKLGEGIIPKNLMPNFASQIEKFNSLPADKIINSISNNAPNLNIQIDKFIDVQGNVDKNCVNDIRNLQNDITNNITKTLTQEFRKLGYK